MISGRNKRNARIATAVMFLALVASPMGVAATEPEPHRKPGPDQPVVIDVQALAAAIPAQVRAIAHSRRALQAERAALADAVVRIEREARIEGTQLRIAEIAELTGLAELNLGDVAESAEVAAWDRDLDVSIVRRLAIDARHLDCETPPAGLVGSAIATLVTVAQLPARAGLVVRHLLGALAKITPRVARALL